MDFRDLPARRIRNAAPIAFAVSALAAGAVLGGASGGTLLALVSALASVAGLLALSRMAPPVGREDVPVTPERSDLPPAPVSPPPPPLPARRRSVNGAAPQLDGLRVLLVDDDPPTLFTTQRLIESLGATVAAVATPGDALTILSEGGDIDVLVTDIVMPGMSGFTLVDLAARVRPDLPVLYISGFPQEEVYWGGALGARSAFLSKPLDTHHLGQSISGLIAEKRRVVEEATTPASDVSLPPPTASAVASDSKSVDGAEMDAALKEPEIRREGRILVVDDDQAIVRSLQKLFSRAGYERPVGITDPTEVRQALIERGFDLMVLDLKMPEMDGFEVLHAIKGVFDPEEFFPIVILTGDDDPGVRRHALAAGAMDFLNKPFDPAEAEARVRNLLATRFLTRRVALQRDTLEERVLERTAELADTRSEILHRLARAAEYRDDVTGRHAERVGLLSSRIADELGLPPKEVDLIRRTAPLHDIGKIGVPDQILRKPGRLTPAEFEVMKTHTTIGALILGGSHHRVLELARDIALCHHERWDGLGYPHGREREEIPVEARIVAVADTFDTIAHTRPYKDALTSTAAIAEIVRCRGTHYDPDVVDAFLSIRDRVGQGEIHGLADPLDPLRDTINPGRPLAGTD